MGYTKASIMKVLEQRKEARAEVRLKEEQTGCGVDESIMRDISI